MKNLITYVACIALVAGTTMNLRAEGNWYQDGSSVWRKNITPTFLDFNTTTIDDVRNSIVVSAGKANPDPAITDSATLVNGYYVITGGQINASTSVALLQQGHTLVANPNVTTETVLKIASLNSSETDKFGVGGFLNLNWYLPTKYLRRTYKVQSTVEVYESTNNFLLTVYGARGSNDAAIGLSATGWKTLTHTQTDEGVVPFRIKVTPGWRAEESHVAYIKAPVFELFTSTEPATRTITTNVSGSGTVTPAYETVHDQDVQIFTIMPNSGATITSVEWNGEDITEEISDNTWTTPLLVADGTLNVTFSGTTTAMEETVAAWHITVCANELQLTGLQAGETVFVYNMNGQLQHRTVVAGTTATFTLTPGIYIVKASAKTAKAIIF